MCFYQLLYSIDYNSCYTNKDSASKEDTTNFENYCLEIADIIYFDADFKKFSKSLFTLYDAIKNSIKCNAELLENFILNVQSNNDRNDINITLFDYDLYYTWGDQQGLKEIDEIDLEEEGDVSYLRSLSIFVP